MAAQYRPVDDNQQEPRTNQRREQGEDAEIPDRIGIDANHTRRTEREQEGKHDSQRSHSAIGWDKNRTDVEEDGIHLSKDTALERFSNALVFAGP